MNKTFNTPEDFYKDAIAQIQEVIKEKLKLIGVQAHEIDYLITKKILNRYTSEPVDNQVLEMYECFGIKLAEFIWTKNGVKQKDINKDEKDFDRNPI